MARLGLFLIGVVVRATEELSRARVGPGDYVRAGAAYAALFIVGVIGLAVDSWPFVPAIERQPLANRTLSSIDARH
jgi:hypothetical protein